MDQVIFTIQEASIFITEWNLKIKVIYENCSNSFIWDKNLNLQELILGDFVFIVIKFFIIYFIR